MGTELPEDLCLQTKRPDAPKAAIVGLTAAEVCLSTVANTEQHLAVGV